MKRLFAHLLFCICLCPHPGVSQADGDLRDLLLEHREFVSIPNVSDVYADMLENYAWVEPRFRQLGFEIDYLESTTLPVFLASLTVDPSAGTILYYLHIDGQAVDASRWHQEDPFIPVLKKQRADDDWEVIPWTSIDESIDPEWRIFGRAAADDKAPIMMLIAALREMQASGAAPGHNIKVILDPQEESGSQAFLSTLQDYKDDYAADYMVILDGPAHPSNNPTLMFGCRGIAQCDITVYGSKLPQHSGHYGNYSPNPVFRMSHLLASMKGEDGRVLIDGYYDKVNLTKEAREILGAVPDDNTEITYNLYLPEHEKVGSNYQEAMQYPSLNVRHIETSWKGPGLKTVIPEYITAHIDVRLVKETDGAEQTELIRKHIEGQGYLVLDREPTDEERRTNNKIATFRTHSYTNAFRTDINSEIGQKLSSVIESEFGQSPVRIRTMGGTVPIIPAVNTLEIPAIIVPMVNMDNNQHNPNENIRIGNIIQGIRICTAMLSIQLQ